MARRRKAWLLTLLALLCFQPAIAQTNSEPLVLHATVLNYDGRRLPQLQPGEFTVLIDKEPQKILSLSGGDVATSVGILVDISGSLGSPSERPASPLLQRITDGIAQLLQVSNPQNEYFVAAFHSKAGLVHDWTTDGHSIRDKLLQLEYKGETALYDGLHKSIEYVVNGRHRKHVIVLVSDGNDNASKKTFKEVRELLKNSDVVLYAIAVISDPMEGSALSEEGKGALSELTSVSGGRAFALSSSAKAKDFNNVFELLGSELRSQYQLAVEPQNIAGAKKWRKLKVKAAQVDASGRKKELKVITREGFYR